jgi:hypothetical protein
VGCDLGDDGLQGLPGVFGAGGAAVRGAQIADEAGEVVQVPAQPVELDRGRVDGPAGEFGVAAQLVAGVGG